MKKLVLVALLSVGFLSAATANELTEAPAEVVQQAIDECKEWAKEDGVAAADLYSFVLKCVNDDLTDQEFKPVAKIDL